MDAIPFDGPFREPSDPQLLNKFLDCVNLAKTSSNQQSFVGNSEVDAQSFVSATSQVQSSDRQKVKSHLCLWYRFLFQYVTIVFLLQSTPVNLKSEWESQRVPISLDYQFGSVLKPRSLPMLGNSGSEIIQCFFSHVISPTHFYVHLLDEISTLIKPLTELLNQLYENSEEVPVTQPEVGSFWVVQEPQNQFWSRAKILSVDKNDEISWKTQVKAKNPTCTVFLVDWGNVEIVSVSQLRPLVKKILDIPCLALHCRLDGIYPFQKSMVFHFICFHYVFELTNKNINCRKVMNGCLRQLTSSWN